MENTELLNIAGHGLFNGFFRLDPRAEKKCPESMQDNVGIFKFGYLVGYLLKIVLVAIFGPQLLAV